MTTTYVIRATIGGPIKIGITGAYRIEDRLSGIQSSHPEKLEIIATAPLDLEDELHTRFQHRQCCGGGEWFHWNDEIEDWLLSDERFRLRSDLTANGRSRDRVTALRGWPDIPSPLPEELDAMLVAALLGYVSIGTAEHGRRAVLWMIEEQGLPVSRHIGETPIFSRNAIVEWIARNAT